ncbi:MAG: DUF2238 domain-containing protein [Candidatus Kapaibacterium sp.]|nr:DUF2238 domain-containing protein [Bacteroidota bacterium]
MGTSIPRAHVVLAAVYCIVLVWSVVQPHDYFTWMLEVFPAVIGMIVLIATRNRFTFTTFAYTFIVLHCCILFVGGHYTYALVPLFDWVKEVFHQSRNNYDKVGHFAQGLVPAIITRELFIRLQVVQRKGWIAFLTVCVCLSISACYEFIEWFVAVVSGESADSFLGTQGYVWDTQSDMLYALLGALTTVLLLARIHDRYIERFTK